MQGTLGHQRRKTRQDRQGVAASRLSPMAQSIADTLRVRQDARD
ncbi:hypothetical protein [Rhodophyticola sp. CCM32]|nr:hypothetical protein [Rhodophyticola sp. CCM32]